MPLQYMLKKCDKEVQKIRENIREKELETNLKFFRQCVVKVKGRVANGSIKEVIRKVDASKTEYEHVKEKIDCNANYVDLERNAFSANKSTTSIIRCANGFNYYRMKDQIMSKNVIGSECTRCSCPES